MSFELLFLLIVAGLIGPLLAGFRKLAIPMVVGEILAGIVIGNSGLQWINPGEPTLQFISSVGMAMLLFLVGTRLPLRDSNLHSALHVGAAATALSFGLAVPLGVALAYLTGLHNGGLFLLLCACSSTSTVMPMLQERKLGGRTIVLTTAWIVMCDISSMVLLPLVMSTGKVFQSALGAAVVTAAASGALFGMKVFRESAKGEELRELSKERGWALDLRLSLAILFGLAWLATKFGTSILVAGFAAGAVVAIIGQPKRFHKQLIGIAEGLFVPIFFVCLGAQINVVHLFTSITNLELALLIFAGSLLAHLLVSKLVRLPAASGLTASAQMGLPAAVVSIGLSTGLVTAGQGAAIIAAALLSLVSCSIGAALLAKAPGTVVGGPDSDKKKKPEDHESDEG